MKPSKTFNSNSKALPIELEKKAKKIDFSSTSRFPKELLVFFENWGNNYARLLSNSLGVRLRTNVKAHMESITQMSYLNYVEQHIGDDISVIYTLAPLKGPFIINLDRKLSGLSIDTISGGNFGEGQGLTEVTDVEKALIRILATYFLEGQQKCWEDYEKVQVKVHSLELNPLMIQLLSDNETVLILEYVIETAHGNFPLKLAIPYQSIENVIEKINKQNSQLEATISQSPEIKLFLNQAIHQMKVETTVELGKTSLTFEQMANLKEGRFIQLNQKITDLLPVYVEGVEVFKVQPVQVKGKLCVQVVEISKNLETELLKRLGGETDVN